MRVRNGKETVYWRHYEEHDFGLYAGNVIFYLLSCGTQQTLFCPLSPSLSISPFSLFLRLFLSLPLRLSLSIRFFLSPSPSFTLSFRLPLSLFTFYPLSPALPLFSQSLLLSLSLLSLSLIHIQLQILHVSVQVGYQRRTSTNAIECSRRSSFFFPLPFSLRLFLFLSPRLNLSVSVCLFSVALIFTC